MRHRLDERHTFIEFCCEIIFSCIGCFIALHPVFRLNYPANNRHFSMSSPNSMKKALGFEKRIGKNQDDGCKTTLSRSTLGFPFAALEFGCHDGVVLQRSTITAENSPLC